MKIPHTSPTREYNHGVSMELITENFEKFFMLMIKIIVYNS
jgi:hypothetical protein